jgi:sterol desaturase/sphingolipid hydroxylase (fatty acid hydroxylase superfamily)
MQRQAPAGIPAFPARYCISKRKERLEFMTTCWKHEFNKTPFDQFPRILCRRSIGHRPARSAWFTPPLPDWAEFIVAFLLLDLTFYYWHVANHSIPWLWRFHNVHHVDPDLDVSTGFRFHFGEVLFSTLFRVFQISFIGVSFATFAAFELVFQMSTLFHHSNLRLPIRWERLLNRILVTPRMHGIHHSQVRGETNSNYGVIFCWWDKLHRTLGLNIPQSKIQVGIAGYCGPEDNRLWRTLTMPFVKQRDYWRKADGSTPERKVEDLQRERRFLAE